jgi:hypothetical protein
LHLRASFATAHTCQALTAAPAHPSIHVLFKTKRLTSAVSMPSSRVPHYQLLPLLLHDPTRLPNSVGTAVCYLWFRSTLPARPCKGLAL